MAKDIAADITYRRDKIRAPFMGILEAGWQAFPLLIAIRYYNAPESIKAFIAGANFSNFCPLPNGLFKLSKFLLSRNSLDAFSFQIWTFCFFNSTNDSFKMGFPVP